MNIQSFQPVNLLLKGIIEQYLFFATEKEMNLQTIPNGRVDASIVTEGEIEWWFPRTKEFSALPACSLYPPTQSKGHVRSLGPLRCIGVKIFPHLLGHEKFQNQKFDEPIAFHSLFKTRERDVELIRELKKADSVQNQVLLLDDYFAKNLLTSKSDRWIQEVIQVMEKECLPSQQKISAIADRMKVSVKTLERRFVKIVGITPVMFSKIIQLQQTVKNVHQVNSAFSHGDLSKALGNGYYDQSHFIKSCKRLTGLTPKKLFTSLPNQMTDIIVLEQRI